MAKIYARRIIEESGLLNAFTIKDVIPYFKVQTLEELERQGYDGYGNKITV